MITGIKQIEFRNIKSVSYGLLTFQPSDEFNRVSGVYGQNGSGKSSLVSAFIILKHILCGNNIDGWFRKLLNVNENSLSIKVDFTLQDHILSYFVELEKDNGSILICKETLSYQDEYLESDIKTKHSLLMQIDNEIVRLLANFAHNQFFVYDTFSSGNADDELSLLVNKGTVEITNFYILEKSIRRLNILMSKIMPSLQLLITKEASSAVLFAKRLDKTIPIVYESTGTKRLLILLNYLLIMFDTNGSLVVVDELDASLYEYLFGEILSVLNKYGKGQLIFSSHNLRALELLPKENIYFATNNNQNKFVRFEKVKKSDNIRSLYLRALSLGSTDIANEITEKDITLAFIKASKNDGK